MACGCNNNCNCNSPLIIPTGTDGADGMDGLFGGWSHEWSFDTATSASPAASNIRLNNAAPASVTEIYVSDTNIDGIDVDAYLDAYDNSGDYGYIKLWKQFNSDIFWMGKVTGVTDNGADHTLTVEYVLHNGTFAATENIVMSFTPTGASGITYFSGSYTTLSSIVSSGGLVPGGSYILTDYETMHEVPGTGITNQAAPGYAGTSEQLLLTAKDTTSFYHEVESIDHPGDDILYDFTLNTVLATARPGLIYKRKANDLDVEAWFDVRNQSVARYDINTAALQWASDPVNRTDVVFNAGIVYQSVRDGASLVNFRLVDDISEISQNLHTNSNINYFGNTLQYDPASISYHDCIELLNCTHIKLGKEVNDVLIDGASHVVVEEESAGISVVSSSNVKIGTSVDQVVLQSVNGASIGKDSRAIFAYSSVNIDIGKTVSEVFIKSSLTTEIGMAHSGALIHDSDETTIGNGGSSIMIIRASNANTVGNNCAGISLGNSSNNLFDQSCSDIDIYSGGHNRFAQGCNVIGLIGELDDAYTGAGNQDAVTPGTYYSPYSQMEHNTFGTGCSNITFEILGGRGNQFGDECKNLTFTVNDYSQPWRLVGCHFCRGIQNKTFQDVIHGTSFVVPNQVTATVASGNWYSQALSFSESGVADYGKLTTSSLYGASTKITFGYYSLLNMPYFNPALTGSNAYNGAYSGTAVTLNDLRTEHITGLAWMWTPEGFPLSMTIVPAIGPAGDPTLSLNP